MSETALLAIALLPGTLLCGAVILTASRRYRRDRDVKKLLVSLVAAIIALIFGFMAQLVVWFYVFQVEAGFSGVTASGVLLAYFATLLSVPAGMAWGWALSLLGSLANAPGQARAPGFIVGGLAYSFLATTVLALAILAARLARYGHDGTIGVPELAADFVFLGGMTLLAVGVMSNFRKMGVGVALRRIGVGFAGSVMLALGIFVAAVAVDSLRPGFARLIEAWNVLIFFYPFYLGGSFALAAVLLLYGGRMFARTWSRPSPA